MNLSQSAASADICNDRNNACNGQRLEKCPAVVVQEEDTLHRDNTSKEKAVCDRACAECLASVIKVSTKADPHSHKSRKREEHCKHEDTRDDLGRRLCICFENVVDLGLGSVALGCGWESERGRSVTSDVQVKDMLVDGGSRTERGENDRSAGRFGGGQELEWEIFLSLDRC